MGRSNSLRSALSFSVSKRASDFCGTMSSDYGTSLMAKPPCDSQLAHQYFSTACFKLAWTLIEKADRSATEAETMIHLAHASLWHGSQRADMMLRNQTIGDWQLSRIDTLLGQSDNARRYGQLCRDGSVGDLPFNRA
jgi:hypothetical protein